MKHHFTFLAVFTSAAILSSSQTEASTTNNCIIPNNISLSPSIEVWKQTREFLSSQLESCLNYSEYFALYGAALLYTGKINTAIEMLERALLINPENGSARIDYALALYESGQLLSALQVNSGLLKEENIPPAIRASLEQRQEVWSSEKTLWRHQFSYSYGHNSNLNNATYIDNYNLNSIYGMINRKNPAPPEPGFYHNSRLISQYYSLTNEGASRLSLAAQSRISPFDDSDADQFSISYEEDSEGLDFNQNWLLGINHIRLGNDALYSSIEGNYWINPRNSISYLNIDTSYTYFDNPEEPSELTLMFEPGVLYTINKHRFGFNLGLGINKALNRERNSGNRSLYEVAAFYGTSIGKGHFSTRLSTTGTSDNRGYSPVLENNAARSTNAWSLSLQYLYPINSHLTLHSSYYYRNQDSNIPIFRTKAEDFNVGLTFSF